MIYYYYAFGLFIESEVELSALIPVSKTAVDVSIKLDKDAGLAIFKHYKDSFLFYSKEDHEVFIDIDKVARFKISNGSEIKIETYSNYNKNKLDMFLLGTIFGVLLLQRRIMPIHGSSIVIENKAIIITGDSGAGKSTLSAAFQMRGYKVLTDDVAALELKDEISVFPSYPQRKLWLDSLNHLELDVSICKELNDRTNKYTVKNHLSFELSPKPLSAIFEIIPYIENTVIIEKVVGLERLKLLVKNTYRIELFEGKPLVAEFFKQWGKIINEVPVYRIMRPINKFTLEEQMKLILETLKI